MLARYLAVCVKRTLSVHNRAKIPDTKVDGNPDERRP